MTKISVTVDEQIGFVRQWLTTKEKFAFTDMLETIEEKIVVVVTFLAILELTKLQVITLLVNDDLSNFYVIKREDQEIEEENIPTEEHGLNE